MSFISYAQNYEDVMLWRALKHVKNGFYIDVGANDPLEHSVTKAFYDRGWRGINIEPLKSHHQDLIEARPNDINLLCAAGSVSGQVDLWECEVRGWSTSSSDVIHQHEQAGHTGVLHKVQVFPLADICEQHAKGEIHFLKIDVEGFEKDVLQGMNFRKFRPWIVVVEATKPNSTEEKHQDWEALIVSNDYVFAYADGLNRFYVSKEQSKSLLASLRYPPNVFDDYIKFQQYELDIRAQKAELRAQQAQDRAIDAEAKAQQAQEQAMRSEEVEAQLHRVYNSTSWRVTAPIRWLVYQLRLLCAHGFMQRVRAGVKKILRKVFFYVYARTELRNIAIKVANKIGMTERLKIFMRRLSISSQHSPKQSISEFTDLTPRAKQIYQNLKRAVEKTEKERA